MQNIRQESDGNDSARRVDSVYIFLICFDINYLIAKIVDFTFVFFVFWDMDVSFCCAVHTMYIYMQSGLATAIKIICYSRIVYVSQQNHTPPPVNMNET